MQRTRTAFVTVVSFGILSMNAQVFSDGDPEGLLFSGHTGGFLGQGVSCVDFNNDGLDDLTFTQYEGQLLAYTNEGQGTFLPADLGVSEYLTQPKAVYWVDLDNPYITFEADYMESVWNLLKQLHSKDLLYKGYTIQPYSRRGVGDQ